MYNKQIHIKISVWLLQTQTYIQCTHTKLTLDPACAFYKNNEFNQRMIEYLVK